LKKGAVFFVTTLSAGIFTFTMGALVNIPVALAPGMGLNTFFKTMTSSCQPNVNGDIDGVECPGWGEDSLPWSDALGAIFLSGVFYLFLTVTGMRTMLLMAIPSSVRAAITAGIGFFLTAVGLHNGALIRINLNNLALGQFVFPAGNCYIPLSPQPGGPHLCENSVDINYKFYSVGFARFNYIPEARIAVVAVVFVTMFEIMKFRGN
jgi:xanthine/uracil/vitamin C permease (AzgA family)